MLRFLKDAKRVLCDLGTVMLWIMMKNPVMFNSFSYIYRSYVNIHMFTDRTGPKSPRRLLYLLADHVKYKMHNRKVNLLLDNSLS